MEPKVTEAELTPFTKMVLLALVSATNGSPKAHVAVPAILSRFRKDKRGFAKKELRRIGRLGWAIRHPTRGEMTWQLTRDGIFVASRVVVE